jgi:hypothetical protein
MAANIKKVIGPQLKIVCNFETKTEGGIWFHRSHFIWTSLLLCGKEKKLEMFSDLLDALNEFEENNFPVRNIKFMMFETDGAEVEEWKSLFNKDGA